MAPEKALSMWTEALRAAGVGGDVKAADLEEFYASLTMCQLGKTDLRFVNAASFHVDRTSAYCSRYPSNHYALSYIKNGIAFVRQGGREVVLNPGDVFLGYTGEPGAFRSKQGPLEIVSLSLSSHSLENWLPTPQDLTAMSLSRQSAWGKALAATMAALSPDISKRLIVPPGAIIEHIECLMALSTGREASPAGSYKLALLRQLRQGIRDHLHEPHFNPGILASEQKISLRTMSSIFAGAGSSFGKEHCSLRMEKARHLLDDPRYSKKSIAEIGWLVGYENVSYFVTQFGRTYGVSPGFYRKLRRS
jgi:AraC-like DNA-binding protein